MSKNDYSTTSCSGQYYNMFIKPDQETFNNRKKLIEDTLKPAYAEASEADRLTGISLYSAKGQYMTAQIKNAQFNKMIEDLNFEKKLAEDNARKAALAKGLSIEEADHLAEMAGKSVQSKIDNMIFINSYQMNQALSQSKNVFEQASENNSVAHSKYMSASLNLDTELFSQKMLAADINKNTGFYNFLRVAEEGLGQMPEEGRGWSV